MAPTELDFASFPNFEFSTEFDFEKPSASHATASSSKKIEPGYVQSESTKASFYTNRGIVRFYENHEIGHEALFLLSVEPETRCYVKTSVILGETMHIFSRNYDPNRKYGDTNPPKLERCQLSANGSTCTYDHAIFEKYLTERFEDSNLYKIILRDNLSILKECPNCKSDKITFKTILRDVRVLAGAAFNTDYPDNYSDLVAKGKGILKCDCVRYHPLDRETRVRDECIQMWIRMVQNCSDCGTDYHTGAARRACLCPLFYSFINKNA